MIKIRQQLEKEEAQNLAPYAMLSVNTAGRVYKEPKDPFRLPFQRDRDRIMHCKSFRRLQAKTQVFVAYFGDHYRDRLTHSIEVSQVARGLARTLGLNEDLSEAISLAHDLGHTPFGHGGEDALNEIMQKFHLYFEHNEQSHRILEKLEQVNPKYDGLNVSIEVLDGMLKHDPHAHNPLTTFNDSPHLESQIADTSDEIAYINHDLDDGLRSGLIRLKQITDFQLWKDAEKEVTRKFGADFVIKSLKSKDERGHRTYRSRVISKIINLMIRDLQETTEINLSVHGIDSIQKVRSHKGKIATFSPQKYNQVKELRSFLLKDFYNHPKVATQIDKGKMIIIKLFKYYNNKPKNLPPTYQKLIKNGERPEVVVKDYIAGMTDHFAEEKFREIT